MRPSTEVRRLTVALIVVIVAGLMWAGARTLTRTQPVLEPRLVGSFATTMGGVLGEDPTKVQRLSYKADLSNTGTAPIRGWKWRLRLAPELAQRIQTVSQPSEGTLDVEPSSSHSLSGEIVFSVQGWSKGDIANREPLVWISITDADDREITTYGRSSDHNQGK